MLQCEWCVPLYKKGSGRIKNDTYKDAFSAFDAYMQGVFAKADEEFRVPNGKRDEAKYEQYAKMLLLVMQIFPSAQITCTHPEEKMSVHSIRVNVGADYVSLFDERKEQFDLLVNLSNTVDVLTETDGFINLLFSVEDMYT